MNLEQGSRNLPRSIGAVVAGIVVGAALSIVTDILLRSAGIFPALGVRMADSLLALATVYRTVYSVLAAYVTARLAPSRPMLHALVGAFIGIVVATIGAIVTWNAGPQYGPHWYPIALIVLALPTAWVGGRVRERRSGRRIAVRPARHKKMVLVQTRSSYFMAAYRSCGCFWVEPPRPLVRGRTGMSRAV